MKSSPMKTPCAIIAFACSFVWISEFGYAQDIDTELSAFAKKIAPLIKENAKKKVTVLDFTDLQGGVSELGRYIAEELTVNLVIEKRDFAVLDRANLNKILAEHKLTATGLVDPENAKKLGMFAGVDTLILGTIIPKGQNVNLTAKIITTDTAEIIGAARAEFKMDETAQQLGSRASLKTDGGGTQPDSMGISQDFGNLRITIDRLRSLESGDISLSLTFQNKSAKNPVAVAMYHDICFVRPCNVRSSLTASDGTRMHCQDSDLTGIRSLRLAPDALTEISPGGAVKATIAFQGGRRMSNRITSFTFQAEMVVNQNFRASDYANFRPDQESPLFRDNRESLPPSCKVHNLILEIPFPGRSK